jgi:hypothetical protein
MWTITYYNEATRAQVASLPTGILASYLRLASAMQTQGVDLRMPH